MEQGHTEDVQRRSRVPLPCEAQVVFVLRERHVQLRCQFIRQARRVASVVVLSALPDTRDKSDRATGFASVKLSPVRICKAMKGKVDPRM